MADSGDVKINTDLRSFFGAFQTAQVRLKSSKAGFMLLFSVKKGHFYCFDSLCWVYRLFIAQVTCL